jgi:hypothetical protein
MDSLRRRRTDRFFLVKDQDAESAVTLVQRLGEVLPELPELSIERIGREGDGALLLCSGEQIAGIVDDYELQLDTDEVDLRVLEEETISVRSIIHAANMLLERLGVDSRLVSIKADLHREVYLALSREGTEQLAEAQRIDEIDREETLEHAGWV